MSLFINNLYCLFLLCIVGTGTSTNTGCIAGTYFNTSSQNCEKCIGDTYCGLDDTCLDACISCPVNTKPDFDHATCSSGVCEVCPLGSWCPEGDRIYGCPVGTYGGRTGLKASIECTYCSQGEYSALTNATSCDLCAKGTYGPNVGLSICGLCEPGKYQTGYGMNNCVLCGVGKYQTGSGMDSKANCSNCQVGTYGTGVGATIYSDCILCGQGTYSTGVGIIMNCTNCVV